MGVVEQLVVEGSNRIAEDAVGEAEGMVVVEVAVEMLWLLTLLRQALIVHPQRNQVRVTPPEMLALNATRRSTRFVIVQAARRTSSLNYFSDMRKNCESVGRQRVVCLSGSLASWKPVSRLMQRIVGRS
ncbi:hypothetical protein PF010_g25828 [Phytophthora fragariae]|uniref:Uncharacterized protein n=1 Tax=Phytophthora fragariae TaxID=53985 RepID=A0A6A3QYT1_9STRA|nr:hypothetical protein PF003_g34632 [Phytophthora fragariae]KAE8922219.1 hypothetical protein PF009_g27514 [Phytophthora fragariae]KAE9070768.1 hypothetical protein PF007_g26816 [Phytophthora fragariae]KAE9071557.1 hypothetical protein PF010_g25828 [Phytophthora fragariae]KAE9085606.1 hypothetical protein PF006_g26217 [Phytophthora fragariae]